MFIWTRPPLEGPARVCYPWGFVLDRCREPLSLCGGKGGPMRNGSLDSTIALARQQNGLSQGELARKMGVSQGTISNWERRKQRPSKSQINKLSSILGAHSFSGRRRPEISEGPSLAGVWLSKARQKSGLTQQELADKAGVAQVTISLIETGRAVNPRPKTIKAIGKGTRGTVRRSGQAPT